MPLKPATKTVLLSSGMRDDGDDFLIEPPSTERVENGRYRKDGVISKRRGFEALPDPAITDEGEPNFLQGIGDNLFTFSNESGYRFNATEDAWSTIETTGFIGTATQDLAVGPIRGIRNVNVINTSTAPGAPADQRILIFEVYQNETESGQNDPMTPIMEVLAQTYEGERFVHQAVLSDAGQPVASQNILGLVHVSFYRPSTGDFRYTSYSYVTNAFSASSLLISTVTDTLHNTADPDGDKQIGFANEDNAKHMMDGSSDGTVTAYLSQGSTGGSLSLTDRDILFGLISAPLSITEALTTGTHLGVIPLAVKLLHGNAGAMVLYGIYETNDGGVGNQPRDFTRTEIKLVRYTFGNPVPVWSVSLFLNTTQAGIGRVPIHGCLGDSNPLVDVVFFAYTLDRAVDRGAAAASYILPDDVGIRYGTRLISTGGLVNTQKLLLGHRLTTNAVVSKPDPGVFATTKINFAFGVQQWFDTTPTGTVIIMNTLEAYTGTSTAQKPVSTMLVTTDWANDRVIPFAVLGPGISQHEDPGNQSSNTHLTQLFSDPLGTVDKFTIVNREILSAGDISAWSGIGVNFRTEPLAPPEAKITVTTIDKLGKPSAAAFGDGTIISAAVPLWFDGSFLMEASPLDQPEIMKVTNLNWNGIDAQGPNMGRYEEVNVQLTDGASTYVIEDWRCLQVVVGYRDSMGNVHRSAPSVPIYAYGFGDANGNQNDRGENVKVHFTPPLSVYTGTDRVYFAELYSGRPEFDEDPRLVAYKTFLPKEQGDPEIFSLSFAEHLDTTGVPADRRIPDRSSPFVYTSGGVLASDPWLQFKASVVTPTRVFALSSNFPGTVFYSKPFEEFVSPEFSAPLTIPFGDERILTAIGKLDDKTIVFEDRRIYAIYGAGPGATGRGQDFVVDNISTDIGCNDQESVVETPAGLVFKNTRGFYLLSPDLNVKFIGGGIEDMSLSTDVIAGTLVPDEFEVRYIVVPNGGVQIDEDGPDANAPIIDRPPTPKFGNSLPANACLVWNYEKNAWSVNTNYAGTAATLFQGQYTRILSDFNTWKESETEWTDPTGTYAMKIISPWIKFRNVQDFARLFRLTFIGRYLSSLRDLGGSVYEAGDIQVTLRHDYETADSITTTHRANVDFQFEPGGLVRPEAFQFSVRPKRQKCQSVQVEFEEVPTVPAEVGEGAYSLGRGFEITAIDLELGLTDHSTRNLSARRGR